jgi:hypothetical protein
MQSDGCSEQVMARCIWKKFIPNLTAAEQVHLLMPTGGVQAGGDHRSVVGRRNTCGTET